MMAKLELVRAEYQGTEVWFDEKGWFNATHEADKYGKRVADWLENQETKDYLYALAQALNVPKERDLIRAKRGREGGTWLHPKLAVAFGRWLNVDFGVWCDLQIDALLSCQHPVFDWKRLRHGSSSSTKVCNEALRVIREEQGKLTQSHHYSNEQRMINWILTGKFEGLDRDSMPIDQLDTLAKLEVKDSVLIGRGLSYDDRKKILEQHAIDLRPALALAQ